MPQPFSVDRYMDAWRRRDLDAILDMHADDAVLEDPIFGAVDRGKDYLAAHMGLEMPLMEEITIEPRSILQEGGHTAALVRVGVLYAQDQAVPGAETLPTRGKRIAFDMGVFLDTDEQGRIQREVWTFDVASTMSQLGVSWDQVERMIERSPLARFGERPQSRPA